MVERGMEDRGLEEGGMEEGGMVDGEIDEGGVTEEGMEGEEGINGDEGKIFQCMLCKYNSRRQWNLKTHIEIVHTKRDSMISCTRCAVREFNTWGELVEHRKSCVFVCEYPDCSWTSKRKTKAAAHRRGHLVMIRRME